MNHYAKEPVTVIIMDMRLLSILKHLLSADVSNYILDKFLIVFTTFPAYTCLLSPFVLSALQQSLL